MEEENIETQRHMQTDDSEPINNSDFEINGTELRIDEPVSLKESNKICSDHQDEFNNVALVNEEVKNSVVLEDQQINTLKSRTPTFVKPSLVFDNVKTIAKNWSEFDSKKGQELFLKGCKWSPDGTCLLTNSNDATMRLFDLPLELYNCHKLHPDHCKFPELRPALRTRIGGLVYDYQWYPLMNSMNPDTCCFVTTSFSTPVQMWDAYSGNLRCSYRGYNAQDEVHAALSVEFNPSADLLLCGYKDSVKIFHTDVPGRDYTTISTKGLCDQRGIVSCLAVNPSMPNIFAAGTYTKSVGMYSVDGHAMCLLTGQTGGLTQLKFSADGAQLFAAARKDSEILCWDLRQLGRVLCAFHRPHNTNQRIYFDLSAEGRYLLSGSSDGWVRVWDLHSAVSSTADSENTVMQPLTQWQAHNDCVNGLSIHNHIPVVATASGQRFVPEILEGEDDSVFVVHRPQGKFEDSVKLWWAGSFCEESTVSGSAAD